MSAVLQLLCVLFRWFLVCVAAFDFSELRSVFDEFVSCVLKEEKTIDFDHRAFGGARPRQLTRTRPVYKEKLVLDPEDQAETDRSHQATAPRCN